MKIEHVALVMLAAFFFNSASEAGAPGFPGKGNPADWSDALPYYNLGNKLLNEGRFPEAVDKFREAIARYQFDPDFYINLGVAYRKLEDFADAEEALKTAVQLAPGDWIAWGDLGNSYLKLNNLSAAANAFNRALKCNPPVADRQWMEDAIRDIQKILSSQARQKQTSTGSPTEQTKQTATGGAPARRASSANYAVRAKQSTPKVTPEALQESGWDWSYK